MDDILGKQYLNLKSLGIQTNIAIIQPVFIVYIKSMKLKKLFWNRNNTLKTFPVSHALLLIISIIWIWNIQWAFNDHFSSRILIALAFSFLLSTLWPVIKIHSNIKNTTNWIFQIIALVLWWIYYFILTKIENVFDATYSESLLYFWILIIAALSIPLLLAILHKKEESKIWFSWNSLITSLTFWLIAWSIVRWWIAWAFWSIEALFDVDIDSNWYAYIWIISEVLLAWSFVFNYYLTLVENINQNKSEFKIQQPRIRRIFWSFIFLPLALIYLLIFWAYWIKILITWVWPNWIIVRLWIGYFVLWILSAYLIYPDKTKIHEIIYKILYVSFILISFMMIWAISQRINQYWITINRRLICFIIAFIIFHSSLSLIFPKKRLISFISTLFILVILALYWPLSANNISFKSQTNRLNSLLSKENISLPLNAWDLKDINEESTKLIIWTVDELVENYNKNKIINKIINYEYQDAYRSARYDIRDFLWVNPDYAYYYPTYKYRHYDQYEWNNSIDVSGFSKIFYFTKFYEDIENTTLKLTVDNSEYIIDLSPYLDELKEKADIYKKSSLTEDEKLILQNPAIIIDENNYRAVISSFSIEETDKKWETHFSNIEWYILIK